MHFARITASNWASCSIAQSTKNLRETYMSIIKRVTRVFRTMCGRVAHDLCANGFYARSCRKHPTGEGLGARVEQLARELALRAVGPRSRPGGQIGPIGKREYGLIWTYSDVNAGAPKTVATNWLHLYAEMVFQKTRCARVAQQEAPASRDGG